MKIWVIKALACRRAGLVVSGSILAAVFCLGGFPAMAEPGFVGMQVQGVTQEVAESLGRKNSHGVLVRDVALGGPANKAGFLRGDLVLKLNEKTIDSFKTLVDIVNGLKADQTVSASVLRQGKEYNLTLKAGNWTAPWQVSKGAFGNIGALGVTLSAVTPKVRESFKMRWGSNGVVVTLVDLEKAGKLKRIMDLRRGDVVVQVDQEEVWQPQHVLDRYANAKKAGRKSLLLLVEGVAGYRFSLLPVY